MRINYSSNEKALPIKNSKGKSKSRIHLFKYEGDKGKDPYAIAAKKLNKPPLFHIPFLKNRYVILKDADPVTEASSVYYKINKNSLCKRLGISATDLESHVDKNRTINDNKFLEEKITQRMDEAYNDAVENYQKLETKAEFAFPQHLDQGEFIKRLVAKLSDSEFEELEKQDVPELIKLLEEKVYSLKSNRQLKVIELEGTKEDPSGTIVLDNPLAGYQNKLALIKLSKSAFAENVKALANLNQELAKLEVENTLPTDQTKEDEPDLKFRIYNYFKQRFRPYYYKEKINPLKLKIEKARLQTLIEGLSKEECAQVLKDVTFNVGHIIQEGYVATAKNDDFLNRQNIQKGVSDILKVAAEEILDLIGNMNDDLKNKFLDKLVDEPLYQVLDAFIICKYRLWEQGKGEDRKVYFERLINKINIEYLGFAISQFIGVENLEEALSYLEIDKYKEIQTQIDALRKKGLSNEVLEIEEGNIYSRAKADDFEEMRLKVVYKALSADKKVHFIGTPFYDPKDVEDKRVEEMNDLQISF